MKSSHQTDDKREEQIAQLTAMLLDTSNLLPRDAEAIAKRRVEEREQGQK